MSNDHKKLVEQARELLEESADRFLDAAPGLLAGLADAVEQLQRERDEHFACAVDGQHQAAKARAHVAELETDHSYVVDQLVRIRHDVLNSLGEGHPLYERHIHDVMSSPAAIPELVRALLEPAEENP